MFRLAFAFILLSFAVGVSAQSILQTQVNTSKSRWSGMGGASVSSNLQERNAYDSETVTTGSLLLNYRLAGTNQLRTSVSGFQEHNHGQESKLNDGQLSWVNNTFWKQSKVLTVGQQVRTILPFSKESYLRDEKRVGVSLVPTFIVNLTPVGLTGVTLSYMPQLTKNFHKYERNKAFESNTEYSVANVFAINWAMTDKLYFQPALVYVNSWGYGGFKKNDVYEFSAELGYMINSSLTVATGVSNSAAIQNFEQGNDQTFELFNNRTASVYAELSYAF